MCYDVLPSTIYWVFFGVYNLLFSVFFIKCNSILHIFAMARYS